MYYISSILYFIICISFLKFWYLIIYIFIIIKALFLKKNQSTRIDQDYVKINIFSWKEYIVVKFLYLEKMKAFNILYNSIGLVINNFYCLKTENRTKILLIIIKNLVLTQITGMPKMLRDKIIFFINSIYISYRDKTTLLNCYNDDLQIDLANNYNKTASIHILTNSTIKLNGYINNVFNVTLPVIKINKSIFLENYNKSLHLQDYKTGSILSKTYMGAIKSHPVIIGVNNKLDVSVKTHINNKLTIDQFESNQKDGTKICRCILDDTVILSNKSFNDISNISDIKDNKMYKLWIFNNVDSNSIIIDNSMINNSKTRLELNKNIINNANQTEEFERYKENCKILQENGYNTSQTQIYMIEFLTKDNSFIDLL